MKKSILGLAVIILLGSLGGLSLVPQRKDKKPIVVDKMAYAEEIVEYEEENNSLEIPSEKVVISTTDLESEDDCEDCACICVRGKSISSVSPDRAKICGIIEILDTDMNTSKETNFNAFDKVVSALKDAGLSEDEITLEYFSCCPSYDYSNGRTLQGYMTSTTFSVKVEDVDNIKTYIDVMTENGATGICNIQYELSTMEEEYANALSNAYENARAKAVKLLGREDLKLVKIKEEMVFASNNLCRTYIEGLSSGLMGKIQIEARVFAEFEASESATAV